MKRTRKVTCIICPVSCNAEVVITHTLKGGKAISIKNIECPRGETYVMNEIKAPVRDFFTIVKVKDAKISVLPVRTTGPIPKERIMDCSLELSKLVVKAPKKLGEVIVKNLLNLGVDIISTRDLEAV